MNANGERREGLFYKKMFWGLIGGAVVVFVGAVSSGYVNLENKIDKKLDKETFVAWQTEVMKRIDGRLESIEESIKTIWRSRTTSRPQE